MNTEGYDQRVIDVAKAASLAVAKNCSAFNVPPQMIFPDIVFAINDAIDAGTLSLTEQSAAPSHPNDMARENERLREALKKSIGEVANLSGCLMNDAVADRIAQVATRLLSTSPSAPSAGVRARALGEAALLCERFTTPYGRAGSEPDAIEGQMRKMASKIRALSANGGDAG